MSFDDTCVKCGRHLYAYCGGETPSHDHVGWVIMGDDGAWCVGCLQDRVEELETSADLHSRMMDRARELYQAAHPGTEDRLPDGAANVAWLVKEVARLQPYERAWDEADAALKGAFTGDEETLLGQAAATAVGLLCQFRARAEAAERLLRDPEVASGVDTLRKQVRQLEVQAGKQASTMQAAAAEIEEHWAAHCDGEGAGPINLMNRLRSGRGTCYPGYCEMLRGERELHAGRVREARRAFADWLMMEGFLIDYGSNVGREAPSDAYARFLKETEEK